MTDTAFEQKHPRGGAGKFAAKEGSEPDVNLDRGVIGFRGPEHSPRADTLWRGDTFDLGYGEADDEETERVLRWVEAEGVTCQAEYQGYGPRARADGSMTGYNSHNYALTLKTAEGGTFETDFFSGSPTAPTITEVVQTMASDAHSYDEYDKDEYLREFGGVPDYGLDEEQNAYGEALYGAVADQTERFADFVGDDYTYLLYGE